MPSFETILLDVEANVATITLNRPDRLNAFTERRAASHGDLSAEDRDKILWKNARRLFKVNTPAG